LLDAISEIGFLAVGVNEGIDAPGFQSRLIAIKRIAGKAHHLAGAGHVAKLGSQIQQANLVFDDILRNTTHGVTPWRLRAG
jgi:hypothetical protein